MLHGARLFALLGWVRSVTRRLFARLLVERRRRRAVRGTPTTATSRRSWAVAGRVTGTTRHWDDASLVPWLSQETGTGIISYDDAESIAHEVDYALSTRSLGGVFTYELSGDAIGSADPLLDAMRDAYDAARPSE